MSFAIGVSTGCIDLQTTAPRGRDSDRLVDADQMSSGTSCEVESGTMVRQGSQSHRQSY